jgi:hypothetical protein
VIPPSVSLRGRHRHRALHLHRQYHHHHPLSVIALGLRFYAFTTLPPLSSHKHLLLRMSFYESRCLLIPFLFSFLGSHFSVISLPR